MKTEEEIKEELVLHLAKTIVAQAADGKRRVIEVVVAICTFLIPSYIGLLRLFYEQIKDVPEFLKVLPLSIWFIVLFYSLYKLIPKEQIIDFKNPDSIIGNQLTGSTVSRRMGILLVSVTILALIEVIVLFYIYGIA